MGNPPSNFVVSRDGYSIYQQAVEATLLQLCDLYVGLDSRRVRDDSVVDMHYLRLRCGLSELTRDRP